MKHDINQLNVMLHYAAHCVTCNYAFICIHLKEEADNVHCSWGRTALLVILAEIYAFY